MGWGQRHRKPRAYLHQWRRYGDCLKGRVTQESAQLAHSPWRITDPIIRCPDRELEQGDEVETSSCVYVLGPKYERQPGAIGGLRTRHG